MELGLDAPGRFAKIHVVVGSRMAVADGKRGPVGTTVGDPPQDGRIRDDTARRAELTRADDARNG